MGAIRRFIVASILLLLATAPAAAVDIAPALDGSSWDRWVELGPNLLEFGDRDWEIFLCLGESEFLLPPLEAGDAEFGLADLEGLLSQVWNRP